MMVVALLAELVAYGYAWSISWKLFVVVFLLMFVRNTRAIWSNPTPAMMAEWFAMDIRKELAKQKAKGKNE